jgi:hypothetical protein
MLGRIVLWLAAVIFGSYGIVCLISPELPAEYAGFSIDSGEAWVEIAAMYGGLQTAFGVFCLLGALRSDLYRPALISIVLLVGGLALTRLYSTLIVPEPVGNYTYGALVFEFTTAILAALALRKPA